MANPLVTITLLILVCKSYDVLSATLVKGGKNVCLHRQSTTVYSTRQTKVSTLQTYTTCCSKFLFCWKKCKRSKVSTKTVTVTVSEIRHENVYHCCDGYTVDSSGTQCSTPMCDPPCENGGKCVEPHVCKCQSGYEGLLCQNDIDECQRAGIHECSQTCINIPGSYLCACKRGFVPNDSSSKTCKDIDECKKLSIDGKRTGPCRCIGDKCKNSCQNTIGGYQCSCGEGFRLTLWKACIDRNECIETPGVCPHKCINTVGSYRCECWDGFRWNQRTRKCEEINECSVGNGGCEQLCHHVQGGHSCSCKRGFYLADNRFSCTDIDECSWTTRCDPRRSLCVNTPGSYYCKCKTGFRFLQAYGICLDRNECTEKTALCNQKCFNTFGSYRCGCQPGYVLEGDLKTCNDIDECKQKKCDQGCVNTPGSYTCFCNQGYALDYDEKTCIPKYCERIQAPFFGTMDCEGFTVGKKCTFSCNNGYHIDHNLPRECLPHGKWSHVSPSCIPNSCNEPRPPLNGKLLLPCDVSFGSTCPVKCIKGYVLRGPNLMKCDIHHGAVTWNANVIKCEEILVCKPSPCQHGGLCRIVNPTEYACNCTGTGYEGKDCDVGFIIAEKLPKMKRNEAVFVTFKAKPERKVELKLYPEDTTIKISKDKVEMTNSSHTDKLRITGTEVGIKLLSYEMTSDQAYSHPRPSMILVYDPISVDRYRVDTLSTLLPDCFSMAGTSSIKTCPTFKLVSTAPWFRKASLLPTTNGIALLNVAGVQFPMFLPGVDQREIFTESGLKYSISRAPKCRQKPIAENTLQYIGRYDVFSRDFIKAFNTLLPSWFQLELRDHFKYFSENMVRSVLVKGETLKGMMYCSALAIDARSVFIVHYIHEHVVLKVGANELHMKTGVPLCLAVDICRKEAHFTLPENYGGEVVGLMSFSKLLSFKWKVQVKSVGFAETSLSDTRKCLKKVGGDQMILFGDSRVEYTNKHGIRSYAAGVIATGVSRRVSKSMMSSSVCVDGESLMESPTWKSSTSQDDPYKSEKDEDSNLVKITTSAADSQKSILSLVQHGGGMFRIKTGLRPMVKKSSRDISFDVSYKVTEKASEAHTDSNYNKYSQLERISFAVGDIDLELELMFPPRYLSALVKELRSKLKPWLDSLNVDLNELIMDIDNTERINGMIQKHFAKGREIAKRVSQVYEQLKMSLDLEVSERIAAAIKIMSFVLAAMGKSMRSVATIKTFDTLSAHFNGSMCLFQPCIESVAVEMRPQPTETPWKGSCYDPSKTSFQIWSTKVSLLSKQRAGSFFTFETGDEFNLCLSVYGVNKGKFSGNFNILGESNRLGFVYANGKIDLPVFTVNINSKYKFLVNSSVGTVLNRWDMMSATVYGTAGPRSKIVAELQKSVDTVSLNYFEKFEQRRKNSISKLERLANEKSPLRGKMHHHQEQLKAADDSYAHATRIYKSREAQYNAKLRLFAQKRDAFVSMERQLDAVCTVKTCYLQCHRIDNCTVCQNSITVEKTVPKCRRAYDNRTYTFKDNFDSTCSHFVEDRRRKYTGNCKEPPIGDIRAKEIIDELNRKQKSKIPFTLEDAWNLRMINEAQGMELEGAVRKQIFWRSFPGKLGNATLGESDFNKIKQYTNSTFAEKIRDKQKKIKLTYLWEELSAKLNKSGGRLYDDDIERIRALDETFATKLKTRLGLNEKLKSGAPLNKEELKLFERLDPKSYGVFIKSTKQMEEKKKIVSRISENIKKGTLSASDLKELEKIDPKAAKSIEEGLKEQLKRKLKEMKAKLNGVSNSIVVGDKENTFGKLNEKLSDMTKNLKPYDKNQLRELQDRIKSAVAEKGSVFDKVSERFDLALELRLLTGVSSEFFRSLDAFSSALDKFDLHEIFLQRENRIVQHLGDLHKWFESLGSLFEKLCKKCKQNCSNGRIVGKTMLKIRETIGKFHAKVCGRTRMVDADELCSSLNKVMAFSQRYDLMKSRGCTEVIQKVVPFIRNIVKEIKNLGRADSVMFEKAWKTSKGTVSIRNDYNAVVNDFKKSLSSASVTVNLPAPDFSIITARVGKIGRPGLYSVKEMEYLVAREALEAFKDAIKLLPIDKKQMFSKRVLIPKEKQASLKGYFQQLVNGLTKSLLKICSDEAGKGEIRAAIDKRITRVLSVAKDLFAKMLKERDLLSFFRGSKTVSATLEHALGLANEVQRMGHRCANVTKSPLRELDAFLSEIRDYTAKSVQDVATDIRNKFRDVGADVKAPIGKLMDLVDEMVANSPSFDVPVILSMGQREARLLLSSMKRYLKMVGEVFKKFIRIKGKCRGCRIEEVLGANSLKSIAEKLDKKLKPVAAKVDKFISDLGFAFKGTALFFTSLEQIRTDLESIASSESTYNEKTFLDIVDGVKYAIDAIEMMEKGQSAFHIKLSGDGNSEIRIFIKELSKLKSYVAELHEKKKGPRLEKAIGKMDKILSSIPAAGKKVESLGKGTVNQLMDTLQEMGSTINDLAHIASDLYQSPVSAYIENDWVPKVAESLDMIERAKITLIPSTERLLLHLGILTDKHGSKSRVLKMRSYARVFQNVRDSAGSRKSRKAARIALQSQSDETHLKRITSYWRGVYRKVAGKIDRVKSHMLELRRKFEKYMDMYKDIKNTVEEIKKGPMAEIGHVKDSLEELIGSVKSYDLKKLLISNPKIFKAKMQELRHLFRASATAINKVDDLLKDCKSCSVESVLGYRYIKDLAKRVEKSFSSYFEFLKDFDNKVAEGVKEFRSVREAVLPLKDRFGKIAKGEKNAAVSLAEFGKAFAESGKDLDAMQGSIERFGEVLLGRDVELQLLTNNVKKIANKLSAVANKSAEVASNVGDAYAEVKKVERILDRIHDGKEGIKKGPVQTRISVAKEASQGIKAAIHALPRVLQSSKKVLASAGIDGDWLDTFESGLMAAATNVEKLRTKTDKVLNAAGVIVQGKNDISKSLEALKRNLNDFRDSPFTEKIAAAKGVSRAFDAFVDETLEAVAASSTELGATLSKEGLVESIHDLIGKERLANISRLGGKVSSALNKIQKDSIPEVGKLTDQVDNYVDGLKDFDVKEALLSNPTVLQEKIGEFQGLADKGGDLLLSIADITGACKSCSLEDILGNGFVSKLTKDVGMTLDELYHGVKDISKRIKTGRKGLQPFLNAAKDISERFHNVLRDGKVTSNAIKSAADGLKQSAARLQSLKGASRDIFMAIFNDENEVIKMQESFTKIIDTVSDKAEKGGILAEKIEKAYATVEDIKTTTSAISVDLKKLGKSPLELKTQIARRMLSHVQDIFRSVPKVLQQSANVGSFLGGDAQWIDNLGSEIVSFNEKATLIFNKTDSMLKSAGLLAKDVSYIGSASKEIIDDVELMRSLPVSEKIESFKSIARKVDDVMDHTMKAASTFESAVESLTGASINISEGIGKFGDSVSGIMLNVTKGINYAERLYTDITDTVKQIEKGPVAKVGALTDSIEDFVGALKNYDLAEVLVQAPKFSKEKIGELKAIIKDSGKMLSNVNTMLGKHCPACDINDVFGKEFSVKVGDGIRKGFDRITRNLTIFLDKVAETGENVAGMTNSVKEIETQVKSLRGIKFDSDGLRKASSVLSKTSNLIGGIGKDSQKLAGVLFEENKELNKLTSKFQGLVGFVGGFMNSTGNVLKGMTGAMDKVGKIRDSFDAVRKGFHGVDKGPLESRLKAVEDVANGLVELVSGVPELAESLGASKQFGTFVRGFGSKLNEVANGISGIVAKTQDLAGDVRETVQSVGKIAQISGNIGNSFNRVLDSPFSGKLTALKDMVNQVKELTGEVNSATGTLSDVVNKVTGMSTLKSPIFGQTTEKVLTDISGAVNLVADRFEKYQSLTKTVDKAFQSASADPIGFAVNDLPKLITQTDSLVSTMLNDTKAIAAKLGLKLEGLNLNPKLVSASNEFFSFAKNTLGTIQSGKELFGNFKDLFTSKDFVGGMKNFQDVVQNGKKFIKNLDSLGKQLFKQDWSGIKGDFQKTLNKIGDSVGINFAKTGKIFDKISGSVTSVLSIVSDVKSLLSIKDLNVETLIQATKSVINIAQSTVSLLNRFGANIQTKAFESIGNYANMALAVFQIGKGIFDFVGWVNDVCDITYVTEANQKELTYRCIKGRLSTMVVNIPVVNCDYVAKNITRGYGKAGFCCNGTRCLYIQNPICLRENSLCAQKRMVFARRSKSLNREIAAAYVQYETARQRMEVAQIDMQTAEITKQRHSMAHNVSLAAWKFNSVQAEETRQNLASINRDLMNMRRVVNLAAKTSRIRFIKAEFNTVLYSSEVLRLPFKVILRDHTGLHKIMRFMMDFQKEKLSIQQFTEYLLRNLTEYRVSRKRRSASNEDKVVESESVSTCAELKSRLSFLAKLTEKLRGRIGNLADNSFHSATRTSNVRMSSNAFLAMRQLLQSIRQLDFGSRPRFVNVLKEWREEAEEWMIMTYKQKCFDLKDCLEIMVENIQRRMDLSRRTDFRLISNLKLTVTTLIGVSYSRRLIKSHILKRLMEVESDLKKINEQAPICHKPPSLDTQLPTSLTAYAGEALALTCKVHASGTMQYQWYLNKTVLPAFRERVLRLKSVTRDYEGSYHCRVDTESGAVESNPVFVLLRKRMRFLEQLESISIPNTGAREARLVCNTTAEEDASYSWWYQSFSGSIRKLRSHSLALDIGAGRTGMSGIFWCEVSNGHMKLRSRKVVVALVDSKRRSHITRFDLPGAFSGRDCHLPKAGHLIGNALHGLIVKGQETAGYRSRVTLESSLSSNLNPGRISISLELQPRGNQRATDLNLASADALTQYRVQKMASSFISGKETLHINSSACKLTLMKSDARVELNPPERKCPPGMGLIKSRLRCETCLPGYFENRLSRCVQCPIGTYQPRFGALSCRPCGKGYLTLYKASIDQASCVSSNFKCFDRINMMLAIDTSKAGRKDSLIAFAQGFIRHFDSSSTKISLVTFDLGARFLTSSDIHTSQEIDEMISAIRFGASQRRIDLLLEMATGLFDAAEPAYRNVLFVAADGSMHDEAAPDFESKIERLKGHGVEIFYMDIGAKEPTKEAMLLSSSPKDAHIFTTAYNEDISKSQTYTAYSVCNDYSSEVKGSVYKDFSSV